MEKYRKQTLSKPTQLIYNVLLKQYVNENPAFNTENPGVKEYVKQLKESLNNYFEKEGKKEYSEHLNLNMRVVPLLL
jgi:hypothetical protein